MIAILLAISWRFSPSRIFSPHAFSVFSDESWAAATADAVLLALMSQYVHVLDCIPAPHAAPAHDWHVLVVGPIQSC